MAAWPTMSNHDRPWQKMERFTGANFDHGEADEIIVLSDSVKRNLMDGWSEKQILTRFKLFKKAGQTVVKELILPQEYRIHDFYLGVVGRDQLGITGIISNIVHGSVTGSEAVTTNDGVWDSEDIVSDAASTVDEDSGVNSEWLLILALCCSFFLVQFFSDSCRSHCFQSSNFASSM